jgi:hypothetical protein
MRNLTNSPPPETIAKILLSIFHADDPSFSPPASRVLRRRYRTCAHEQAPQAWQISPPEWPHRAPWADDRGARDFEIWPASPHVDLRVLEWLATDVGPRATRLGNETALRATTHGAFVAPDRSPGRASGGLAAGPPAPGQVSAAAGRVARLGQISRLVGLSCWSTRASRAVVTARTKLRRPVRSWTRCSADS